MKRLKADFRISRIMNSDSDDNIRIVAEDAASRSQLFEVRMSVAQLGLAVTGASVSIAGTKSEHKTENVFVPKGALPRTGDSDARAFKEAARRLLFDYEVDGWRARYNDMQNRHNIVANLGNDGTTYRVVFNRNVRADGTPWYPGVDVDDFLDAACDEGIISDEVLDKLRLFNRYQREQKNNG